MTTTQSLPLFPLTLSRPRGLARLLTAAAGGVIWLHLLDASIVHPQTNATLGEHLLLALLALAAGPLAYLGQQRFGRALRGATSSIVGLVAFVSGAVMHVAGIIRNDEWVRSDFTGVPMAFAGFALLVVGVTLLTLAIPRRRYRLLMIPGAVFALVLVVAPAGAATFITHVPRTVVHAEELGAAYEEVAFETSDGVTLRGWYVPSTNGAAVALLHGSGGARTGVVEHARMLIRHGYGVLAFDSRGHGESDGATVATGWGAREDFVAAARYLADRPDVDPARIGILGSSMGAELAIEAAAHANGFAAVVADGPSGRTLADGLDSSPPVADSVVWLPILLGSELLVTVLTGEPAPPPLLDLAPRVDEPVLYIASAQEPYERVLVTKLAAASGGPSELWLVDAGHTQGLKQFPAEYERRVLEFFDRLLLGTEGE